MSPQILNYSAARRVSPISCRSKRLAIVLLAGLGLQGCAGVLPSKNYAPAAPPPFALLSERTVAASIDALPRAEESARSLPEWVAYALDNNPRITAAIASYEAAVEQVPQVTALPDPKLSYRHFLEEVETRVGPQEFAVGLSQPLPWLGKLRLQGKVASQAAQAAGARVSSVQNEIISDVASAWYELFYFDRALEIMRGNRDLVVHLERVARTRYGTGASGHPDVIRAQVELGKIENDLASLTDREAPLLARLNAALNRPSSAPIKMPTEAPLELLSQRDDELIKRVAGNNPELQALPQRQKSVPTRIFSPISPSALTTLQPTTHGHRTLLEVVTIQSQPLSQ